MRVVGRYFALGATIGSVSGLVTLALIWTWMTVHWGTFGFLVGWIPAGLAGAAIWVTMVVFWGPILVVGAMVSLALLLLGGRPGRGPGRDWRSEAPPAVSEPDETPAPTDPEGRPREISPPSEVERPKYDAPPIMPKSPDETAPERSPPPANSPPASRAVTSPAPSTAHAAPPTDDLGGDAAAAGDTSRRPPH